MRVWHLARGFVLTLFLGCSPLSPFNSSPFDPSLTQRLGGGDHSAKCPALELNDQSEIGVTQFRVLAKCLNTNQTLQKTELWLSSVSDQDLLPLVSLLNQSLFKNPRGLSELKKIIEVFLSDAELNDSRKILGELMHKPLVVKNSLELLDLFLNVEKETNEARALQIISKNLDGTSFLRGSQFILESQAVQQVAQNLVGASHELLHTFSDGVEAHVKSSASEKNFVLNVLSGFAFRNYFGLLSETKNRLGPHWHGRIASFAKTIFENNSSGESRYEKLTKLFGSLKEPLHCLNQSRTLKDPVQLLSDFIVPRSSQAVREYFRKEMPIELLLLESTCALSSEVWTGLGAVSEFWQYPEEFETGVVLAQEFAKISDVDFFKSYFSESSFDHLTKAWNLILQSSSLQNTMIFLADIDSRHQSDFKESLGFWLKLRPELEYQSVLGVWIKSLSQGGRFFKLAEIIQNFTSEISRSEVQKLLSVLIRLHELGLDGLLKDIIVWPLNHSVESDSLAPFIKSQIQNPLLMNALTQEWASRIQSGEVDQILLGIAQLFKAQNIVETQTVRLLKLQHANNESVQDLRSRSAKVPADTCWISVMAKDWAKISKNCFNAETRMGADLLPEFLTRLPTWMVDLSRDRPSRGVESWLAQLQTPEGRRDLNAFAGELLKVENQEKFFRLGSEFNQLGKNEQESLRLGVSQILRSEAVLKKWAEALIGPHRARAPLLLPPLSLPDTIRAVEQIEGVTDPRAAFHRAQKIIREETQSMNSYEWLLENRRYSWGEDELWSRLKHLLQRFDSQVVESLSKNLFERNPELATWIKDRSNDYRLISFRAPHSKKSEARWVNTLEVFELVVASADFEDPLGVNYALKFTQWMALAWGDEDPSNWPDEIRAMYPNPKKERPLTLRQALDKIDNWISAASRLDWATGQKIRNSLFNFTSLWPIILENLPQSGHVNAGGLKVVRDLFYSLYHATDPKFRNARAGDAHRLSLVSDMINLGLLHQISLTSWNLNLEESRGLFKFFSSDLSQISPQNLISRLLSAESLEPLYRSLFRSKELPLLARLGGESLGLLSKYSLSQLFFGPLEKLSALELKDALQGLNFVIQQEGLFGSFEKLLDTPSSHQSVDLVSNLLKPGFHAAGLKYLGSLEGLDFGPSSLGSISPVFITEEYSDIRLILSRTLDADTDWITQKAFENETVFKSFCTATGTSLTHGEWDDFFALLSRAFPR